MSADDFQTKYSSVMESMLKAAIAETTKLFETMVDELKAEISRIKRENEDLKRRCSLFENARNQPSLTSRQGESVAGPNGGCDRRDRAVQCGELLWPLPIANLVPFRTVLVEQCQPLRHSSFQNQERQCSYEGIGYSLQDHNYGEGTAQMAFLLVKQESVLKQEEVEPTVVCELVLSDKAGSTQAASGGMENERPLINQECSTQEIPLLQKDEETRVDMKLPCLGMDSNLQGAQNQSSELGHSLVISFAALKDNIEEDFEVSQKILETEEDLLTSNNHPVMVAQLQPEVEPLEKEQPSMVAQQCQREDKTSMNEQADGTLQEHANVQCTEALSTPFNKGNACAELKSGMAEGEAIAQPDSSVRRRRGRPPKKSKCLNEIGSLAISVASLSRPKPSESQQLSMEMEEGTIQAPSTVISSATETLNTPTVQPRERHSSVTLQDAILLVEAMNQSTAQNAFSSPQRMAAPRHTQGSPHVGTLQTVDEVPAEPQTPQLHVETHKAAGSLSVTKPSTATQSSIEKQGAVPTAADATPNNGAEAHIKGVIPKQQHTLTPSNTASTSVLSLTAAVQTNVQSLQQHSSHPLITSASAHSKPDEAVSHKVIVMPRSASSFIPQKIAPLSPTQLPTVVSKVVASQRNSLIQGSTAAGLPLRTTSLSSGSQKTIYVTPRKATSKDLQSGTSTHPKITIIIPRQVSAVASRKHQQTIVLTAKQESAKSAAAVTMSSPQLISLPQESGVSVDTQTASDEIAILLTEKRDNTLDKLESPKHTASLSETSTEPFSSLNMSHGQVSPPGFEQKLSAVVRLTRLPFPVSAKEAVFVSELPRDDSSETQSGLQEGTTQEKLSSLVISRQSSETLALSTDTCPSFSRVSTSQLTEPNDIQEKVSLPFENSTTLEKSLNSRPFTPSKVSAYVFESSTIDKDLSEPPDVSGTAGELNSDKEIISFAMKDALPDDPPIHLTSITNKDASDPHLQMTKAQFLAQLAVSPITQDTKKASSNDSVGATASCSAISTSYKKSLQKNTLVARLRSHLKTHLQSRRTETNQERHTEIETCHVNPKKPRLVKEDPNDKDTTTGPIPISLKNPRVAEDITYLKTSDATPISPRRSGLCKQCDRPKQTVVKPTSVSSRRFSATHESTSVSSMRCSSSRDGVGSKTKKTNYVSRRRTNSLIPKTKKSSLSPKRSNSTKESDSPKNKKSASVSPGRSGLTKENANPKKTKNIPVHLRRVSSARDGASPKKGVSPKSTKTTSVSPKRTSWTRNDASPKKTKSTSVSPRMSSLSKKATSPKVSSNESTSLCRRRCTLPKDVSITTQIKTESNSFSPGYSTTSDVGSAKTTACETSSPSVRWLKLAKDGNSSRNTGGSTPAKKSRLIQDDGGPENSSRVVNAKKLAQAEKDKTVAKIKNSSQSNLQNEAKISEMREKHASCDAVRKCTARAVWTPPTMVTNGKTPPAGGKRASLLPAKKEISAPKSQDHTVVYPPSVSLFPIPVRAPPVVSPLQPLSVIGRRLLKNQCGECGRVLSSIAALESHVSLHRGRRPFSCTLCGKSFPDSKGLKRHGRVHRNGRIHVCQQCGKGFVYSFGLTKHLQMVHSRIKPFICQICNKGFFTRRDVEAHIRMHTGEKPFHCNLCEKKFARRVELNVHLRWHNGEKRHWCPFCGKGFLDFNNLKRHKYIHTGEKPHSCPHCPKQFTQSGHLKKHVRNVHKIQ
ncbi:uncharacterized protein LOC121941992 isoform X2 [Plectropomus leopardus]|uniref:uncharacterized protein LOC121941992 isoform X2 n=1 Tax=Plectropomus leopardus TaxID=160734 RepID=UPI001C4AC357|nr:uncharacterized protein LOC121941992 isoform X2 [Plectropomus leopardus]